jgi:DeoR family fructose operon transcriptional repressor
VTMYAEERQLAIAKLVGELGRVSVADIADRFDVTTETVRRDLSALERAGLVRRVHGGAVPPAAIAALEPGVSEREQANTTQKHLIAQAALAQLPPPGATVLIDAGTTTSRLARALPADHRLTVTTHAVPVAARLATSPQIELHLLPGQVRPTTQAAVGADTVTALSRLRVDVCFLATNGISLTHGLSTPDHGEAAVKRAMVAAARRVICLADASKLGVEATHRFAELADIDVLVTDSGIDDDVKKALGASGIEVVIA